MYMQNHPLMEEDCLFSCEEFETCDHVAYKVLTNKKNMQQKILEDKVTIEEVREHIIDSSGTSVKATSKSTTTFVRFSDKVEQYYQVLEQMIDQQAQASREDGFEVKLKLSPRRQLEGFDFLDLVEDRDPILPYIYTLDDFGTGWVDFVRTLKAIVIFGKGFGELMKPKNSAKICSEWRTVPKNRDYLTVSTAILRDLLDRGDKSEQPWRLVDDIHWHTPGKSFEPCNCAQRSSRSTHCDRVQVLLPANYKRLWGRSFRSPASLKEEGAFIFGHSLKFPLRWKDHGDPTQERVTQNELAEQTTVHDNDLQSRSSLSTAQENLAAISESTSTQNDSETSGNQTSQTSVSSFSRRLAPLKQKFRIRFDTRRTQE